MDRIEEEQPRKYPTSTRPSFSWRAKTGAVSALAILALLGTSTIETRPAQALGEQSPAQKIEPFTPTQRLPSFAPLVEHVKSAVVSIRVKAEQSGGNVIFQDRSQGGGDDEDNNQDNFQDYFFRYFFPRGMPHGFAPRGKQIVQAQGSGFFISSDGYLVTNNHVVQNAVSVEIQMDDGKTYPATVIGTDPKTDLALLKVDAKREFAFAPLSHAEVQVGDWVVALGNPFGLGGTVTAGIVSARGRNIGEGPYDDFIQIDAPVNRGNSGGPTFNQNGEVIGVNTAIYSPSGGSVGIAFAIPASTVERVIGQLKDKGKVVRGWLGVQIQTVTPELAETLGLKEPQGALIAALSPGGPAEKAGLPTGAVVVEVNGQPVKDDRDLARKIADIPPGSEVKLTLMTDGKRDNFTLKLGELPDNPVKNASVDRSKGTSELMSGLGFNVTPSRSGGGVTVTQVDPSGAAAESGLQEGDVITQIEKKEIGSVSDLRKTFKDAADAGKSRVLALVKRGGTPLYLTLPVKKG